MKLYGSQTSPFVRRLRLLLKNQSYEFIKLNIGDPKDRERLRLVSPVLKIPVFEIDDKLVYDSRQIFNVLKEKGVHPQLSVEEENILTVIDGISDSLVQLFLVERSGVNLSNENSYRKNNEERIQLSVQHLEQLMKCGNFNSWDYPSICLFSLIDWATFRNRFDFSSYPELLRWYQANQKQPFVKETDPRLV